MSDVEKYIAKRKKRSAGFARNYEGDYQKFEFSVILKQAREQSGITQEVVAQRLGTKKSAISRIENHAEDIRLSTLGKYAKAVGKKLRVELINE